MPAFKSIFDFLPCLCTPTEHRCRTPAQRGRTFAVGDIYEGQGGAMGRTQDEVGNSWLSVNVLQWLQQSTDLAVTLSGVCLCAFWTALLYHLL